VRIALLYLDFVRFFVISERCCGDLIIVVMSHCQATGLANLGTLKPGFQAVTSLTRPLKLLLSRFTSLMNEFGEFCE